MRNIRDFSSLGRRVCTQHGSSGQRVLWSSSGQTGACDGEGQARTLLGCLAAQGCPETVSNGRGPRWGKLLLVGALQEPSRGPLARRAVRPTGGVRGGDEGPQGEPSLYLTILIYVEHNPMLERIRRNWHTIDTWGRSAEGISETGSCSVWG